jgi:hypothetical protein
MPVTGKPIIEAYDKIFLSRNLVGINLLVDDSVFDGCILGEVDEDEDGHDMPVLFSRSVLVS